MSLRVVRQLETERGQRVQDVELVQLLFEQAVLV